jgi:hypothetical protein
MKAITNVGFGVAVLFAALLTTMPAAASEVTACVGKGGHIVRAAVGSAPLKNCKSKQTQVTLGATGISCWDLNQDGIEDAAEDFNKDGIVDVLDCRPAEVYAGNPKDRTWYVSSSVLLQVLDGTPPEGTPLPPRDDDHYLAIYDTAVAGCLPAFGETAKTDCLKVPIVDPCGLWGWPEGLSDPASTSWAATAKGAYHYATQNYLGWDGSAYFGWQQCRDVCLSDSQCVGASVEAVDKTENSVVCKLLAKTPAPGNIPFRNDGIGTLQDMANGWAGRDWNIIIAPRGAVLSVCPTP